MKFTQTKIPGAYLIDLEKKGDERGFFARFFCAQEFQQQGLEHRFIQANNSLSTEKGTLRGIHYQLAPKAEDKLVRCLKGALWDVVVDLRPDSPTYKQWFGAELTEENRRMMYVPKGCGHAFITLAKDTEVLYLVSEYYSPELERGIRWDDPTFKIVWPMAPHIISERDSRHPDYDCGAQ